DGPRQEVAARIKWAGIKYMMDRKPIAAKGLIDRGVWLWRIYETQDLVSRAYWLDDSAGKDLEKQYWEFPAGLKAEPLSYLRPREDCFQVSGIAPHDGWLYVSEPRYPGWEAYLDGK